MKARNIIVIGASAGGFKPIQELIASLPANLDASIFITWHISPDVKGILPDILNRENNLLASNAVDGEPIKTNRVYVAPPDHHLLVDKDVVRVRHGPKENRFRPAIDPLFRSAAYAYGSRVTGIILSGALDDGTAGLWTIKQFGGMAMVQTPLESEVSSMPESAMRSVAVDHVLPISGMAAILTQWVEEQVMKMPEIQVEEDYVTRIEIGIAMEKEVNDSDVIKLGKLSPYTCPDCHGVLTSLVEGSRMRFRCHTGHAFSADNLLKAITHSVEDSLWNAIRSIQESVMLLNHMGDHFAEVNQPKLAALYFQKAQEAEDRAKIVKDTVINHEHLSTKNFEA